MSKLTVSRTDFNNFKTDVATTYATKSEIKAANYSTIGDLAAYQLKGDYALKSDLSGYQVKGDYALNSALSEFQPKGDYALNSDLTGLKSDLSGYQVKGDYALNSALTGYQVKGEYQPKGDYALNSALSGYQPKGNYALKGNSPGTYGNSIKDYFCIGPRWCIVAEGANGEHLVFRDILTGGDKRYYMAPGQFKNL